MKITRDYLTSAELGYIINAMVEKDSAVEREIVKVALVAQLLCEDIGDFEDCNDIYDKVISDSTINFSKIVNNYDIIDKLYAEETGVNKILKDFIEDINKKIDDSIKNLDLNSVISQLKEIADKGDIINVKSKSVQKSPRNKTVSK